MSDQSPSHRARVKVQFWVPTEAAGEIERWREVAKDQGVELGPWLRGMANFAARSSRTEKENSMSGEPEISIHEFYRTVNGKEQVGRIEKRDDLYYLTIDGERTLLDDDGSIIAQAFLDAVTTYLRTPNGNQQRRRRAKG